MRGSRDTEPVVVTQSADGRRLARAPTADSERNLESLDALAATGAGTVLLGHGEPWTGGARAIVDQARAAGVG
jgi:hypothetical protein